MVKGTVAMVTTCRWLDRGSKTLLRDFIRQPALSKLLRMACQHFQLTVGTNSFLGAGAFGFVFRAVRQDGRCVALKLVLEKEESVLRLEREMAAMRMAHEKCPSEVMGVENEGFARFDDGAVLLMSKVGEPYSKLDPQSIVKSLQTLHKNNIIHGDARLDNVVCVDEKPCWIDFMDASFVGGRLSIEAELKSLVESVQERFHYNPIL
jgi:serine/threonine protein kinase